MIGRNKLVNVLQIFFFLIILSLDLEPMIK